jgi:methyl coenzyme M reductase subunit D
VDRFTVGLPKDTKSLEYILAKKYPKNEERIIVAAENLPEKVKYGRSIGFYFNHEIEDRLLSRIYKDTFDYYVVHSKSKATEKLN